MPDSQYLPIQLPVFHPSEFATPQSPTAVSATTFPEFSYFRRAFRFKIARKWYEIIVDYELLLHYHQAISSVKSLTKDSM
jgi:hypothetical protein